MATAREIMTADAECVGDHESILDAARKMTSLGSERCPSAAATRGSRAF